MVKTPAQSAPQKAMELSHTSDTGILQKIYVENTKFVLWLCATPVSAIAKGREMRRRM